MHKSEAICDVEQKRIQLSNQGSEKSEKWEKVRIWDSEARFSKKSGFWEFGLIFLYWISVIFWYFPKKKLFFWLKTIYLIFQENRFSIERVLIGGDSVLLSERVRYGGLVLKKDWSSEGSVRIPASNKIDVLPNKIKFVFDGLLRPHTIQNYFMWLTIMCSLVCIGIFV